LAHGACFRAWQACSAGACRSARNRFGRQKSPPAHWARPFSLAVFFLLPHAGAQRPSSRCLFRFSARRPPKRRQGRARLRRCMPARCAKSG
jgi:hypothetical protein